MLNLVFNKSSKASARLLFAMGLFIIYFLKRQEKRSK